MKFFAAICFLFLMNVVSFAQCIPDTSITHNDPGIYPDSATGLPHAVVGVPYSTVIQTKVLTDSVVPPFTAIVDSIVIDNVSGLPPGFTYSCTPSSCSFPGGSNACILLEGPAPSSNLAGAYPLVVHTTIYFTLAGTPSSTTDNNDDYSIVIDPINGISYTDKQSFSVGQSQPNPAEDIVLIPVTLVRPDVVNLKIVNLIGKNVISRNFSLPKGKSNLSVDLHGLQPGIYLYTISNSVNSVSKRMIISND